MKGVPSPLPTSGSSLLPEYGQLTGLRMSRLIGPRQPSRTIGRPFWWQTTTRQLLGSRPFISTLSLCGSGNEPGSRIWPWRHSVGPAGSGRRCWMRPKPGLATMAPPGSHWSPERPGSMPIASMNARVRTAGPDLSDGRFRFCRAVADRWAIRLPPPDPVTRACARPPRPQQPGPVPGQPRAVPSSPLPLCQRRSPRTRPHATG